MVVSTGSGTPLYTIELNQHPSIMKSPFFWGWLIIPTEVCTIEYIYKFHSTTRGFTRDNLVQKNHTYKKNIAKVGYMEGVTYDTYNCSHEYGTFSIAEVWNDACKTHDSAITVGMFNINMAKVTHCDEKWYDMVSSNVESKMWWFGTLMCLCI